MPMPTESGQVENEWRHVEHLIELHTMPAAQERQVAAVRNLVLASFDTGQRSRGCAHAYQEEDCIHRGGTRLCTKALRAQIAALGEGSGRC